MVRKFERKYVFVCFQSVRGKCLTFISVHLRREIDIYIGNNTQNTVIEITRKSQYVKKDAIYLKIKRKIIYETRIS